MNDVSLLRLYLLRAMYLLITVGLGIVVIPDVIHHARPWTRMEGASQCMLAAFWALSALGLRYPLQMLPILLWELSWKSLWLLIVALPAWLSGSMDQGTAAMASEILVVVLIPFVIPWNYVFAHYVQKAGNRWHNASVTPLSSQPQALKGTP